jgi:hypothetical protein
MRRGFGGGRRFGGGMMRGRGMFRPGLARNPLGGQARGQLMQANQLMLAGQAIEAATIFASIGLFAQQNGMPARSANLSARAALAYLEANDLAHAKEYALKAASQSLDGGNVQQAVRIAQQVLAQMKARNITQEADAMKAQFDALLSPYGVTLAAGGTAPAQVHGKLPVQCPSCLGPVRPDAVEWIDDQTAECAFCGNIIRVE